MIDEIEFSKAWSASKKDMQNMAYSPFRVGYVEGYKDATANPIKILMGKLVEQQQLMSRFERSYSEGYTTAEKLVEVKEHINKVIHGYKQAIDILELCETKNTPDGNTTC